MGYKNIEIVSNGKEVLQILQQKDFDLILMDCIMPEMSGLEATEEIRKFPLHKQPIIIALTADAFEENKKKCLR